MILIRVFTHVLEQTRLRSPALVLLALLAGAGCDDNDPVATSAPTDLPTTVATTDAVTATDAATATDAVPLTDGPSLALTNSYSGIPFGPFNLWNSYTTVAWGPAPFNGAQVYAGASGIVTLINAARSKRQRLVLAMTGGPSTNYTTYGKFDMAKWQRKMNTFNTTTIKNAVAAGVADGTIIGNSILDEPETPRWGGVLTKPRLDQMAGYVKAMFPTLPVGVNYGTTGFKWRTAERYTRVDYTLNNYTWWITQGNVAAWRDMVLTQARRDGVKPAFVINILGGGIQNWTTKACPIPLTGGYGPYPPTCRMTPDQVRNWGRTLGIAGCALFVWQYDWAFMSKSANVQAFRDVAATMASRPRPSCRRA